MKKVLLSIIAFLAWAGTAIAQNSLTVEDVNLPQNYEADLVVKFHFAESSVGVFSGFQFEITLPAGLAVEYVTDSKGNPVYSLGDCYEDQGGNPSITPNIIGEGVLSCGGYTYNTTPISVADGILLKFRIKPTTTIAVGTNGTGSLKNVKLSTEGGNSVTLADSEFEVEIVDAVELRTVLDENSTTIPEAATGVDVRVKRTINANTWSTICLPFAMTEAQVKAAFGNDVELGDFTGCEATEDVNENVTALTISFDNVNIIDGIEANHPYIIKVSQGINHDDGFTVDGVNIEPADEPSVDKDEYRTGSGTKKDPYVYHYNSFVGTYIADTEVPNLCLFLNNNNFFYSKGLTTMKAFRAYFDFYDVLSEVEESSSARVRMYLTDEDENTTMIENADFLPVENGRIYSVFGRYVGEDVNTDNLQKGVYIVNGKKKVIK